MNNRELQALKVLSAKIRLNILKMLHHRGYGHVGGSLSIVEVLSVLYGHIMNIDRNNPHWNERDMLVLSKGHAGPGLYSALAVMGFIDESWLLTLNEGGTRLPSHPDRLKTPGIDMTTGSLGQGISAAAGMATGLKIKGSKQKVYCIVGDGELNEGQCWEAFQYIAHQKLHNCIVIIDDNKKSLDGPTADSLDSRSIADKMRAFGFMTQHIKGNDEAAIGRALERCDDVDDQAVCLVLDTIKGQGVPYFEVLADNHSVKFNNAAINEATTTAISALEVWIERRLGCSS